MTGGTSTTEGKTEKSTKSLETTIKTGIGLKYTISGNSFIQCLHSLSNAWLHDNLNMFTCQYLI